MAASSAAAAATSCSISRPVFFEPFKLSADRSLLCPALGGLRTSHRRLFTLPRRRILPVVKAKKETFPSFDDLVENSDKPVLVDFYATWCGPCQFMVPILDEVSTELKDKLVVVKVDTEKYPDIANRYGVEALPTFIIFRDGKPCDRFEGALPANQLIRRIEDALQVAQ
ncbi:unnamed protein product [Spirodela intermedia]|uniref:Thioredoxin domain-containing protein n=1 Tax=Spirodela intermedia TaxID=51605 RepID=A0A7I8IS11_SPIIN|nr:unnamed protein product [Spirodela intermedia]CAA6660545.1 unnamed protein product [Spirodela intermedia]